LSRGTNLSAPLTRDRLEPRFRFETEPNERHRIDWVVEIEPFDPAARPVKRTALARFTHDRRARPS